MMGGFVFRLRGREPPPKVEKWRERQYGRGQTCEWIGDGLFVAFPDADGISRLRSVVMADGDEITVYRGG